MSDSGDSQTKMFDLILFGVTGFTGKLAAEYLLSHYAKSEDEQQHKKPIQWAACARNQEKAQAVLRDTLLLVQKNKKNLLANKEQGETMQEQENEQELQVDERLLPPVLVADLQCSTSQDRDQLKKVVQQTRLVLSTAGPYSKYGTTLVQICAELGVHYCDITGETNFVRSMISKHDATARESGAILICHCGNDCIPQDLMVYELNRYAKEKLNGATLQQVTTYNEVADTAEFSGGTVATALYNLGGGGGTGGGREGSPQKPLDESNSKPDFDPLLLTTLGEKSTYSTKNTTPKSSVVFTDLGKKASPWIMGPVMVNCVRRSNALLQYSENLEYADLILESSDWSPWLKQQANRALLAAAMVMPSLQGLLLPSPGQGPSREHMEEGYLILHARATATTGQQQQLLKGQFRFGKDVSYLYTAALLVETGLLLLEKAKDIKGGVWTPASALGHDLTLRILERLDASLEISVV